MTVPNPSAASIIVALALLAATAGADDLQTALDTLNAVGPQGQGNAAATRAWRQVAQADAAQVPKILTALDTANPLTANWIRTAVDAVCQRTLQNGGNLPQDALERFVLDTAHAPKGRRLAYEWLLQVEPDAEQRIVPRFLSDPSLELRRDAVARLIAQAKASPDDEKPELLKQAFHAARDRDQVGAIAAALKELQIPVDLVAHDGLIVDWHVIGPFDNHEEAGFATVYPPERGVDLQTKHQGKRDSIGWVAHQSANPQGSIDLYAALADTLEGKHEKEITAYATTVFHSPTEQTVQIRSSSFCALKIWVNDQLVSDHEVYHSGTSFDQYCGQATLKQGPNRILVKLCQNAQTQDWTNRFAFQLRICDAIGSGILSQDQ